MFNPGISNLQCKRSYIVTGTAFVREACCYIIKYRDKKDENIVEENKIDGCPLLQK
jgi:hypothetical protein